MIGLIVAACAITIWPELQTPRAYDFSTFHVRALDGSPMPTSSWKQHPVVINFWSPDCGVCVAELPRLEALQREDAAKGLILVGVAMPYDDPAEVRAFAATHGLTYWQGQDPSGALRRIVGGIDVLPTTVLLSPRGRLLWRVEGPVDIPTLRLTVASYLHTTRTSFRAASTRSPTRSP